MLVTRSLDVKLSYFGLARLEPAFMSPEQLRDAPCLRALRSELRAEIEAIVADAMQKDAAGRYQS